MPEHVIYPALNRTAFARYILMVASNHCADIFILLLRWCSEIEVLLDQLARKMGRGNLPKKSPRKNTEPREFDLTQPKARPLPAPEVIPQQDKFKPASVKMNT